MRRRTRLFVICASALLALPLLAVAGLFLLGNTEMGRRVLEHAVTRATGGEVILEGLGGTFPAALRVARLELRDRKGTWAQASDVQLKWSPAQLASRTLAIDDLTAATVMLRRSPQADEERAQEGSTGNGRLPLHIKVDRLEVPRLELGSEIAGQPAIFALSGRGSVSSTSHFDVTVQVQRQDQPGSYRIVARSTRDTVAAGIDIREPPQGFLARLAGMPDLGDLSVKGNVDGPRNALRLHAEIGAGPARAGAQGVVDLDAARLQLQIDVRAPAMQPAPDVAWESAELNLNVHGSFTRPEVAGRGSMLGLLVHGIGLRKLDAALTGTAGAVNLDATADAVRLPGEHPDLLAAAPIRLQAQARVDEPSRPITFELAHPLLEATGRATTAGQPTLNARVRVPQLARLASTVGVDVQGRAAIEIDAADRGAFTDIGINGSIALERGQPTLVALIGKDALLKGSLSLRGSTIEAKHVELQGQRLRLSATGALRGDAYEMDWRASVQDLAGLAAPLRGSMEAQGHARGTSRDVTLEAQLRAQIGGGDVPLGPVTAQAQIRGPFEALTGTLAVQGTLADAPLALAIAVSRQPDDAIRVKIERGEWKTARAQGELVLARGGSSLSGRVHWQVDRLGDLQPLLAQPLGGSVRGEIQLMPGRTSALARIEANGRELRIAEVAIDQLMVSGTVGGLPARPDVDLKFSTGEARFHGVQARAQGSVSGPLDLLALQLTGDVDGLTGGRVALSGRGSLQIPAQAARVELLVAKQGDRQARLLQPVRIDFADGLTLDRLRVGYANAVLDVTGRLLPQLDVSASLRNFTADLAKAYVPAPDARGTLNAQANLTGAPSAPQGRIHVDVTGFRMRSGTAAALPPASLVADLDLHGTYASLSSRLDAGPRTAIAATGRVPIDPAQPMRVNLGGTIDLAAVDPIVEAQGRRVAGQAKLDLELDGTFSAPRVKGTIALANGEVQDYGLGAQLTDVTSLLRLEGDQLRIERLTARAGAGTVTVSGTVGVLQAGIPMDLLVTARDAKPLESALLTATLDADVHIKGLAASRLDASGRVHVQRAEITVPDRLPPSVAVLDVRSPNDATTSNEQASSPDAPTVGLALAIEAPRAVFIRGRGLDAELQGEVQVKGTARTPQFSGGLELRRGTFDLAGATLKFTRGKVTFAGRSVDRTLDPLLDLVAESTAGNVTAKLEVTGSARAPKIALSSTPELPQDEVLSRLIFGVSAKDLTPLQLVQIASAVATLSGMTGGGAGTLAQVQRRLGLDRLSVGANPSGSGASVEAGRYVSDRVYVGARETTSGATQAKVQVDLTKHLKVQTTIGTGGGTVQGVTPENDPGSSLGFVYQIEY